MVNYSRRHFCKSGLLFVPTLFAISHIYGQDGFLGQSKNGLLTGLVGYWKTDESGTPSSFADATGNGWTGTPNGGPAAQLGIINNGMQDGSGLGFSVSSNIDTRAAATPFTVQIWIKSNGVSGAGNAMIGEWGSSRNDWVLFNSSGENATFRSNNTTPSSTDVLGGVATVGAWTHFLFGYDGTNVFISRNGATRVTASATNVRRAGGNLIVGNYQGFSLGWNATVDEIGYWTVALSVAQGQTLYNNGNAFAFGNFTN